MPKVALSKFHMPKFQLIKFHMPKVLYAEIPIAKIHWSPLKSLFITFYLLSNALSFSCLSVLIKEKGYIMDF